MAFKEKNMYHIASYHTILDTIHHMIPRTKHHILCCEPWIRYIMCFGLISLESHPETRHRTSYTNVSVLQKATYLVYQRQEKCNHTIYTIIWYNDIIIHTHTDDSMLIKQKSSSKKKRRKSLGSPCSPGCPSRVKTSPSSLTVKKRFIPVIVVHPFGTTWDRLI